MPDIELIVKVKTAGQRELEATKQALSGTTGEVRKTDAALQQFDETADSAAQSIGRTSSAIEDLRASFKRLQEPLPAAAKALEQTGTGAESASGGFLDLAANTLGVNRNMLALGGTVAVAGAALITAAKGAYDLVAAEAELAQRTDNIARTMGIATGEAVRLQAQSKIVGVGFGVLATAAAAAGSELADNGAKGEILRRRYAEAGIATATLSGKQRDHGAVLLDVLRALSNVEDGTRRLALADELLTSRGAEGLRPMIANLGELNSAVKEMGRGFDGNIKILSEAEREIQKAGVEWEAFKRKLAAKIAPIVIPIVRVITDAVKAKAAQEDAVPDSIALARASEASRTLTAAELNSSGRTDSIRRSQARDLMAQDVAGGRQIAESHRTRRLSTEDGLKDRLKVVEAEADEKRQRLLNRSGLSSASAGILSREVDALDAESASIKARIESIHKAAADAKKNIAELKALEIELSKLQSEAELKPYGEVGRIEARRRDKVADIESKLPRGASRNALVAGFNSAFGDELAAAARTQAHKERQGRQLLDRLSLTGTQSRRDLTRSIFGDGSFLREAREAFRDGAAEAQQFIRFAGDRYDDQTRYLQRRNQVLSGPGDDARLVATNLQLELDLVQKRRDVELEIAQKSLEGHQLRMRQNEIERDYERDSIRAREEAELRILEVRKQATEQAGNSLYQLISGKVGGRDFLAGQLETVQRNSFDRICKNVLGPMLGRIGKATGLGSLLSGTIFDGDQALTPEARSRKDNTEAIKENTAVLRGGSGMPITGNPGLDSILGQMPGATPPFLPSGNGQAPGLNGFLSGIGSVLSGGLFRGFSGKDYSIAGPDGRTTTASSLGLTSGAGRVGNIVGSAAVVGAGSAGIVSGIRQGGARGTLSAIEGGLSIASAIPGPQQPFIQAAALVAGLFKGLFPDAKQVRDQEIRDEMEKRRYNEPRAIERIEDRRGNTLDTDYQGNLRPVVFNISAIDSKSFLDRADDIAAAVTRVLPRNDALQAGIKKTVFGVA